MAANPRRNPAAWVVRSFPDRYAEPGGEYVAEVVVGGEEAEVEGVRPGNGESGSTGRPWRREAAAVCEHPPRFGVEPLPAGDVHLRVAGPYDVERAVVVEEAHSAGLPVTAHAHGLPAVHMAMAASVDGIEHCSFLTDKGISQSEEDLARLAEADTAVCPTVGMAGTPVPPPNAMATLGKLGMTMEQMIEMRKRRVAQIHAAGVRIVSGSGYDADLLVVDGNPVTDIGALARPAAVFAAGRRPTGA